MHLNLSPLTRKVNFTLLSKAIKSQRASHAFGAGRLRNVYSTDTHNRRKKKKTLTHSRGHAWAEGCTHSRSIPCLHFEFYVFPAETLFLSLPPLVILVFFSFSFLHPLYFSSPRPMCFLTLSFSQADTSARMLCCWSERRKGA